MKIRSRSFLPGACVCEGEGDSLLSSLSLPPLGSPFD